MIIICISRIIIINDEEEEDNDNNGGDDCDGVVMTTYLLTSHRCRLHTILDSTTKSKIIIAVAHSNFGFFQPLLPFSPPSSPYFFPSSSPYVFNLFFPHPLPSFPLLLFHHHPHIFPTSSSQYLHPLLPLTSFPHPPFMFPTSSPLPPSVPPSPYLFFPSSPFPVFPEKM